MNLSPRRIHQHSKGQISKNDKLSSNSYHVSLSVFNFFSPSGDFSVWPFLGSEYNHKPGLLPKCGSSSTLTSVNSSKYNCTGTIKQGHRGNCYLILIRLTVFMPTLHS